MEIHQNETEILTVYKKLQSVMDMPGFRPLIKCASEIFSAPVIFTDVDYRLISMYPVKKIGDLVYDTFIESGALPIDLIASFQDAYLDKPGKYYEPFFEKEGLVKDMPRIFAEVHDDEHILGHLGIFINRPLIESWHLEAASILASILKAKIKLTKDFVPSLSNDLNELISSRNSSNVQLRSSATLYQLLNDPGILLVAPFGQSTSKQAFISVVLNYCLQKYPDTIPTICDADLVILIFNKRKQPPSVLAETAQSIAAFLWEHRIICGAVYPVDNLTRMPDYYIQAKYTALGACRKSDVSKHTTGESIGSTPPRLTFYDETAPEPMYVFLSEHAEFKSFISPIFATISDFDAENNTDLLVTLQAYCHCMFKKNETSQMLHIHRNTLMYRLGRIEELFGLDLQEARVRHQLLVSFELQKYL